MKLHLPRKLTPRRLALFAVLLAAVLLMAVSLRPKPVPVEAARASRGPLQVTIDEEGETRVRHRYVLGAPVTGHLRRIDLDEGDAVASGAVVARLDPAPLDSRDREQAETRLAAAEDSRREADAAVPRQRAALEESRRTLRRLERLAKEEVIAADELDAARTAERQAASDLRAAQFRAQAAAHDVETARAALLASDAARRPGQGKAFDLRSPVAGQVLRVCEECEKVVAAGTPLLEVGDPGDLEVVVDLLSDDAVHVRPGAPMILEAGSEGEGAGEGGEMQTLRARVRLVEPSGFTKVSPLGVEEQRVNVIGDFVDPPGRLGDRYRVEAKIVLWQSPDVLQVPAGALFRDGGGWAVFTLESGRARLRRVDIGHRNPLAVEIRKGLQPGETVIVHPGDQIADGVKVEGG